MNQTFTYSRKIEIAIRNMDFNDIAKIADAFIPPDGINQFETFEDGFKLALKANGQTINKAMFEFDSEFYFIGNEDDVLNKIAHAEP